MPRRTVAAACLAASGLLVGLLPGLVGPVAGSSCSAWTSETVPPPTIRVFRHATGTIDTVAFKPYTKNVLSREWIGSWTAASLQSGALIVRNDAWYQVLHWRGGVRRQCQWMEGVPMGNPGLRPRRHDRLADRPRLLLPRRHDHRPRRTQR